MRSQVRWCLIFGTSLTTLSGTAALLSHAQVTRLASINRADAESTEPETAANVADDDLPENAQGPQIRRAFFQDAGGLGMPNIPNNLPQPGMPTSQMPAQDMPAQAMPNLVLPNADRQQAVLPPNSGVNPAAYDQFSQPGGAMVPTQVQQPAAQLRTRTQPNYAGQNYPGQNSAGQPHYAGQGNYQNIALQQQVMPGGYAPQNSLTNQEGQLRPSTGGIPMGQPNVGYQPQVVAGDSRYVMPAPRGRYTTTPYTGPYRQVAYQLPQVNPPSQPVQPPSVLPNQPQTVPMTSALPQYQPTVGATAVSYQTLQPGYCTPGIPANGVPAYVPGATAPPTLPPNMAPQLYTPDNAGYRPLFSLGQENYNVQLGRGIIGQPTVYVAGQPIRNFLRYLSP